MRTLKASILLVAIPLLFLATLVAAALHQPHDDAPIKVGVILSQSGRADYIGRAERQVLDQLLLQYRAAGAADPFRGVTFEFADSGGDPGRALTLFRRFADDRAVVAVIGPSTSGESIVVAKETDSMDTPLVVLSLAASRDILQEPTDTATDSPPRKWVFKFAQNDDLAAARLASTMVARGARRIGLLYSSDPFGTSGARVFRDAVKDAGVLDLVHDVAIPADLMRPESIIGAIPKDLDALLIWGTAPGPALLVKECRRAQLPSDLYLSHGNASGEFIRDVGPAGEGIILVGSRVLTPEDHLSENDPTQAPLVAFRRFWTARFTGEPSHFGGHARDALVALQTVLADGPQVRTRAGLQRALERQIQQMHGVTGTFTFSDRDHAGLDQSAFETFMIRNGRFVPLANVK